MSQHISFFKNLGYHDYAMKYQLDDLLGIDIAEYGSFDKKLEDSSIYSGVDPKNDKPYPVEMDDLIRLHYLATSRKVTTILEFGIGKSTLIFDHAIIENEKNHSSYVSKNLRRSNPFEVHSIDDDEKWVTFFNKQNNVSNRVHLTLSESYMSTFQDRVCTLYRKIPNICPDLIYLDAPHQFSPTGEVNGITTNHFDRLPMSADILIIEHFLLPGTLIVVDGRTANARFLKSNLQRDWEYCYSSEYDQHFFELKEPPLGELNRKQIEYCLGADWLKSVKK